MGYKRIKPTSHMEPFGAQPGEAARLLGVSKNTVFNLLNQGLLDSTLVNGCRIISIPSIKRLATPQQTRQLRKGIHNRGSQDNTV